MKLLKQRPNLVLVSLLIFIILLIVGLAISYNAVLGDIQIERDELRNNYDATSAELEDATARILEMQGELDKKASDVETFDELYDETTENLEQTQTALSSTQNSLESARKTISDQSTKIKDLEATVVDLAADVLTLGTQVEDLTDDKKDLEDDLDDVCDEIVVEPSSKVENICEDY